MSNLSAKESERRNIKRRCSYKHCGESRVGLSKYCGYHRRNTRHNGHPEARSIRSTEWKYELLLAQDFLARHQEHDGIKAVLSELSKFLASGAPRFRHRARQVIERLVANGVQADDVLEMTCGLWLFSRWHPNTLDDDARLTYAIGRAFHKLASTRLDKFEDIYTKETVYKYSNIASADVRDLGHYLRDVTGALCLNVAIAIEHEQEEIKMLQRMKLTPFETP